MVLFDCVIVVLKHPLENLVEPLCSDYRGAQSLGNTEARVRPVQQEGNRQRNATRLPPDLLRHSRDILCPLLDVAFDFRVARSEEHTSELQSLTNLVCRL